MKLKHLFLGCAFAITILASSKMDALAYDNPLSSTDTLKAVEPKYGVEQTGVWNDAMMNTLYKVSLDKAGIISVSADKAKSNTLGQLSMDFYIYDTNGEEMLMYRDGSDDATGKWSIGLDKGTYYMNFKPQYSSFAGTDSFKYKIDFEATECAEKELNEDGKTATEMKLDTVYTGFFGNGFSNINKNKDDGDYYKVYLTKGYTYLLKVSNNENIAGVWEKEDVSGFPNYSVDKSFVAPYTGWYYPGLYNYGNGQYKYTIEVKTVGVPNEIAKVKEIVPKFGEEQTGVWNKTTFETVYKLNLDKAGIVSLNAEKATNKTLGLLAMDISLYDTKGNELLMYRDERKDPTAQWSAGLDKGTYYLKFKPQYTSYTPEEKFKYKINFKATEYAEKELNNTGKTATEIKPDTLYTGFFGNGFSNLSSNKDTGDYYKVYLTKGYKYMLKVSNSKNIAGIWKKDSVSGFADYSVDKEFVAPYSGWYYPGLYNYGNDQYQYTIEVRTVGVPCPATKLKSVKGGKKSLTVKWNKKACDGYDIMYSTSKKFKKGVKTVSIGKAATTKKTIKKLKKKKTYYVKVRTYKMYNGKKYTSKWSSAKKAVVK